MFVSIPGLSYHKTYGLKFEMNFGLQKIVFESQVVGVLEVVCVSFCRGSMCFRNPLDIS